MAKKPNVEDFTGAVNVNADVTPVTRQPIDQVDASDWKNAPVADLQEHLAILNKRAGIANHLGNTLLLTQINRGIAQLKFLIKEKTNDDVGLIR